MIKWDYKQSKITNEEDIYVKLPNRVVWVYKDENSKLEGIIIDQSLRALINYNFTVSALYTLYTNLNLKGYTTFSIEELMESCGYKSNKNTIKKFKEFLKELREMNIISNLSIDLNSIKPKELIKCHLNLGINREFFLVYEYQYETIFNSKYTTEEKNNAFTFLCYVLSRIKRISSKFEEQNKANLNATFCFFGLEKAQYDLGINKKTLLSVRDILKELNLLYFDFVGTEYHNRNCCTIYALSKKALLNGLQWSIEYYYLNSPSFKCKEEYKYLYKPQPNEAKDKFISYNGMDNIPPTIIEEEAPKIKEVVEEVYDYSYEYEEPIEEEPIEEEYEYEPIEEEITEVVGEAVNYIVNGMDFSALM